MTTCSAPAKIYLFGEHAVVYGEPAIACAVELRTQVTVEPASSTTVISGGVPTRIESAPYIIEALEQIRRVHPVPDVSIHITSDIPTGAGVGSSAALTVALLQALSIEFGVDIDILQIASMAYGVELSVQGAASQTDTFISTMGGMALMPDRIFLPHLECSMVVGDTNMRGKTSTMVAKVAELKNAYPKVAEHIIKSIGILAHIGVVLLEKKDYLGVGRLMNINHGLLESLGVGTSSLSQLVYRARDAGAFGAKITGAGGGGCMVALTDKPEDVIKSIECCYGKAMVVKPAREGVREE
ncbi:MAG: Mevalonate kinase [Candidatus Argoarchaeum ethanivorans]|uniref:Mevalonate kinase n=1 Tax=Candidatus Argoarchaeum ethanivorans TaxID=2608793 RepID=A0A811T4V4_9EURY|nr:MAG: Mevalonate kinase [Candidatus Argoarchaeum ethanivorans]